MRIAVPIKAIITGEKNIALLDHPKFMLDGKALGDAVYSADPLVNSMLTIDEYSYANETELMDLGSVHELLKQLRGNLPYAPKNYNENQLGNRYVLSLSAYDYGTSIVFDIIGVPNQSILFGYEYYRADSKAKVYSKDNQTTVYGKIAKNDELEVEILALGSQRLDIKGIWSPDYSETHSFENYDTDNPEDNGKRLTYFLREAGTSTPKQFIKQAVENDAFSLPEELYNNFFEERVLSELSEDAKCEMTARLIDASLRPDNIWLYDRMPFLSAAIIEFPLGLGQQRRLTVSQAASTGYHNGAEYSSRQEFIRILPDMKSSGWDSFGSVVIDALGMDIINQESAADFTQLDKKRFSATLDTMPDDIVINYSYDPSDWNKALNP